ARFFFSSRRRHTSSDRDWSSDVCSSDLVMVGLGTIFIAVMVVAAILLWRGKLYDSRGMLWILMVSVPLPYIANTAGWMTAELGRSEERRVGKGGGAGGGRDTARTLTHSG